jgi:hypothetical protein
MKAIPKHLASMLADRAWRMHHYLWHEVRNMWLFYDDETRRRLENLGWRPPRPARRPGPNGPEVILDNGEDFLYMHREMIAVVNEHMRGDPDYPRVQGWTKVPRPRDPDDPVPPSWLTGIGDLDAFLVWVKSDEAFERDFVRWEREYRDETRLRSRSLAELGARLEFTIHNQMHMRWCSEPVTGIRPEVEPAHPQGIDPMWDDPRYDWLGDPYASHVNPTFWKLHGWIDERIDDWAAANGVAEPIGWQGTWVGKMPSHPTPHTLMSDLAQRADVLGAHPPAHGDLNEMVEVARLIARTGQFCHFYDTVVIPD